MTLTDRRRKRGRARRSLHSVGVHVPYWVPRGDQSEILIQIVARHYWAGQATSMRMCGGGPMKHAEREAAPGRKPRPATVLLGIVGAIPCPFPAVEPPC
jgi:hypothetical protein